MLDPARPADAMPIAGGILAPNALALLPEADGLAPEPEETPEEMSAGDAIRFVGHDVSDEGGFAMRAASFCAVAMAAAIWWLGQMSPGIRHQSILMLVPALGAAIGPFFLINGVRAGLRLRKYGHSVIEIERPVQGEPLRGIIRTQHPVDAIGRYTVRLRCEDIQGRSVATTLFRSVCYVAHGKVDSTVGIPFAIEPQNSAQNDANWDRMTASKVRWWIDVSALSEFIGYRATFEITDLMHQRPESDELPWWMQSDPVAAT